jgi:hypothetical protein
LSHPDASWHEMPGIPLPGWLSHQPDEQLLDMILAGRPLPPDAPHGLHAVADQLAGMAPSPGPGPLPGEAAALAAFSRAVHPGGTPVRPRRQAVSRLHRLVTAGRLRLAAAGAAIAITLGSTAAAYAGALPAPVQNLAHRLIDAPTAHGGSGGSLQPRTHPGAPRASRGAGGSSHAHSLPPGQSKGHRGHAKNAHPAKPGRTGAARASTHAHKPKH